MVAGFDPCNAFAHRLDYACAFMTDHNRHWMAGCTGRKVPVAMANPGRSNLYKNLTAARRIKFKRLDHQRGVRLVKNSGAGFHALSLRTYSVSGLKQITTTPSAFGGHSSLSKEGKNSIPSPKKASGAVAQVLCPPFLKGDAFRFSGT
jgi:hypothetical protein